jgi:hypothetical protein
MIASAFAYLVVIPGGNLRLARTAANLTGASHAH